MKAIYNKISLLVIALLITKVSSAWPDNVIYKYCVVHSWSPKGPEGDYANPYSNYIISLSTVSAPADYQQPDITDFETQNENYLYVKKSQIDNDGSDDGSLSSYSTFKGDESNQMLSNFCPTEKGQEDPQFNTPFVFWIVANFCDDNLNETLYPQKRLIAHFAFFKNWFNAYQKFKALADLPGNYYSVGWSRDGTIENDNILGGLQNRMINYRDDAAVGDRVCNRAD
jgi:hypothetical protein